MGDVRSLTELEGAVLEAIELRGHDTAYQVRRSFERSFSVQWRGSAGAVSPAVHRLEAAGLIKSSPHPSRNGKTLALTDAGRSALQVWAKDVVLASGAGMDPFRLRAGMWLQLPPKSRRVLFRRLAKQLDAEIATLEAREYEDMPDQIQTELAIELLRSRLRWLAAQRGG